MLELTRKKNQQVRIGHDLILTVKNIEGNRVRLTFDAPLSVPIVRCELEGPGGAKILAREIAVAILDNIFTNGAGQRAARLVLESVDGRDLGGWGEKPMLDAIIDSLLRQMPAAA